MSFRPLKIVPLLMLSHAVLANGTEVTSENIKILLEANNPKFSVSRLNAQSAEDREGVFLRSFLPSVELYGAQESFRLGARSNKSQPAYGVHATVNLFNGGRDFLKNEFLKLETVKKKFSSQRVLLEELKRARTFYWKIRYLQEKAKLLKGTLEVNRKNLKSALRRIESGVATNSDRFEFEMKDVELRRDLAETELTIQSEKRLFSLILGLDPSTLRFPESLSHDHAYEDLLKHNAKDHEFLFKETEIEAMQLYLSSKSNRRAWWPKLDAYAAHNQFNEREKEFAAARDRKETAIGLRLSMAIGTGLESIYEADGMDKEAMAFLALANFERAEMEAHLENEKAELKFLHDQVHEAEENIKRAEVYYSMTQSEYARGAKNSPDVLGASEKLFDMQHKRLEIIRDFQVAKSHVFSKIGK